MGVTATRAEVEAGPVPAPVIPMADDLVRAVAHAQGELGRATDTGTLRRDPYRYVLGGLSETLGILLKITRRWESAVNDVVAARHPLSQDEKDALRRDIVEATRAGMPGAAADVLKLARAQDRRNLALAFGGGLVALVLAAGGAYWAGRASARAEAAALIQAQRAEIVLAQERVMLPLASARVWLRLIQANADPAEALGKASHSGIDKDGRRFAAVPLWLDPQTVPPTARRQ